MLDAVRLFGDKEDGAGLVGIQIVCAVVAGVGLRDLEDEGVRVPLVVKAHYVLELGKQPEGFNK